MLSKEIILENIGTVTIVATTIITAIASVVATAIVQWRKIKSLHHTGHEEQRAYIDAQVEGLNGLLNASLGALPYPAWIKKAVHREDGTLEFRMQYFNKAYELLFDIERASYLGKTDYDVWPDSIADEYYSNDVIAFNTGKSVLSEELVVIEGVTQRLLVEKHKMKDDKHAGVMGFVKPLDMQLDKMLQMPTDSLPGVSNGSDSNVDPEGEFKNA